MLQDPRRSRHATRDDTARVRLVAREFAFRIELSQLQPYTSRLARIVDRWPSEEASANPLSGAKHGHSNKELNHI
jgi:hypothetical protein